MKRIVMLFGFIAPLLSPNAQEAAFDTYPVYTGNGLGLQYTSSRSAFRIWAPIAQQAVLTLYGEPGEPVLIADMQKDRDGTWLAIIQRDLKGYAYGFRVLVNGIWSDEVPDPYAKTVTINGKRGLVADLSATNPPGWEQEQSPVVKDPTEAIIYELHVRDASISPTSGIKNKGKFLGLTENGTKNADGLSTGLDHLKELGVTHVHLLPCFDFSSIDETKPDDKYNWGYDPLNYNVPEGSYSINPFDGVTRINEFKQLIKTFHDNGLRVIMDVVYNHTAFTETSNFNQIVPGYYYRQTKDGKFSNATACGNETASERPLFRKFMLESVLYWVQEYHVDGFRFDLMGVHDIETMNLISKELHKIKPDILLYGEGWTAGPSPLPDSLGALKKNVSQLDRIAVFSDEIRDGIKGNVFQHDDRGFVSGKPGMEESVKFGIVASTRHPQLDYSKVNYSEAPYAREPQQVITYADCHDNHVLWDKLAVSATQSTAAERKEMHKLAMSIVLTSQGISFLHAGTEFLRTKMGVENSYTSPDSINAIDWDLKTKNIDVFTYVQKLIALRKTHPAFRMTRSEQIRKHLNFIENLQEGIIGYTINGSAVDDPWKKIAVYFNGNSKGQTVKIDGKWHFAIHNSLFPPAPETVTGTIQLNPYSCVVIYQE